MTDLLPPEPEAFVLRVNNGTGAGSYTPNTIVTLRANPAPVGNVFDRWVAISGNPTISNLLTATTTLTMPSGAAQVSATYRESSTSKPYEAEAMTSANDARISNVHPGFTGTGFIDFGGLGSWAEWSNIAVASAGDYHLRFGYANGGAPRQCVVIVNGTAVGNVAFSSTDSWTTWKTENIKVSLRAGSNTVRLRAITAAGGPNLDSMSVIGAGANAVTYLLDVKNGTGDGLYLGNQAVTIRADAPAAGKQFDRWMIESGSPRIANPSAASTTVTLGTGPSVITATYKDIGTEDARIDAVFLAQTHVLQPTDPYFTLTSNRPALLKVHVISPSAGQAPVVRANVILGNNRRELTLQGPAMLPRSLPSAPGQVQHTFSDSFTVMIPAQWVRQGMRVEIQAKNSVVAHDIKVGASNPVPMQMFDIHYFKPSTGDYPAGFLQELQAKWPVSSLTIERVRNVVFPELVIPARPGVGAPHVRVRSREEYKAKTGQNFDGEQAAALQWVHALSASGGNYDTSLGYVNIVGVPAGGQAGSFDGVGSINSVGVLHHELGHALGLPHWGEATGYPYRGDMYGITAPPQELHVGPHWAFDLTSKTFIPPTVQRDIAVKGMYKLDPMWGGGSGQQEAPFLLNHFSDYSVFRMQDYLTKKLAVFRSGRYYRWNDQTGDYTRDITEGLGIRYPLETGVQVISVMAAVTLADKTVNMIYPPIGPYKGNRIYTFNPASQADRTAAITRQFCPNGGCDFTLRVMQGGKQTTYMLPAAGDAASSPLSVSSLKTVAVNLRAIDGPVTKVELLLTPDSENTGLPANPEILAIWPQ